jgi:hypothetical protein
MAIDTIFPMKSPAEGFTSHQKSEKVRDTRINAEYTEALRPAKLAFVRIKFFF